MAIFYAKHQLYPDNPQLFVIDAKQIIKLRGEPNTSFSYNRRSEHYWEIIIYTSAVDSSGDQLGPYWLDVTGTDQSVHEMINNKVSEICGEIDWSKSNATEDEYTSQIDRYAPKVVWTYPSDGQTSVPIDSAIIVRIMDQLPASGIDISTLVFKVDGFIVTPTITGNKYDYVLYYKPLIGA